MRNSRSKSCVVMGALVAMLAIMPSTAATSSASTEVASASSSGAVVQRSIDDILKQNPGARQVSAKSVDLPDGSIITVQSRAEHVCRSGWLCLYSENSYSGEVWEASVCGFYDIGREWGNDKIRSYKNNQTGGTVSDFYNWNSGTNHFDHVIASTAIDYQPIAPAAAQIAEGVKVC